MTQETQNTVALSLEDISLMVSIISTVSRRGAIAPEEFSVVGAFFERLRAFLPVQENEDDSSDTEQVPTTLDTVNSEKESNVISIDFTGVKA